MKRKLIKQGHDCITLTLPIRWVKDNHLKAGDEVTLTEKNNGLLVQGKGTPPHSSTLVTIPKNATAKIVSFMITNAYKKGYDVINVKYQDQKIVPIIEKTVNGLLGHELIDIQNGKVTVKNVSLELEEEYQTLFRKSFYLYKENMRKLQEDLKNHSFTRLPELEEYKSLITKYTHHAKRALNKNQRDRNTFVFEFLVIRDFEKLTNEVLYIYRHLSRQKHKVDLKTQRVLIHTLHIATELMKHYFKKDTSYLPTLIRAKDAFLFTELPGLLQDKKTNHVVLHHAANIMRRCSDISGPFYVLFL